MKDEKQKAENKRPGSSFILPPSSFRPRPTGYQKWRHLLFVHWRVSAEALRPLLPERLTVDTFDGDAWVGVVPFDMRGVRPWWSPPLPGVSDFHETNVRTYVHADGVPGVWFFTLDAASSLAVQVARRRWSLPYFRSAMTLRRKGDAVRYTGRRLWPEPTGADYDVAAEIGPPLPPSVPGSLEHFLVERYVLFAARRDDALCRGSVRHVPYPLREARLTHLTESLRMAAGLPSGDAEPDHVCFSEGVDVTIFPLTPV